MTVYAHNDFDDYLLVEVEIYDRHTGSNWTAEISGAAQDICRQWLRTERLLARAGFSLGWGPGAFIGAPSIIWSWLRRLRTVAGSSMRQISSYKLQEGYLWRIEFLCDFVICGANNAGYDRF